MPQGSQPSQRTDVFGTMNSCRNNLKYRSTPKFRTNPFCRPSHCSSEVSKDSVSMVTLFANLRKKCDSSNRAILKIFMIAGCILITFAVLINLSMLPTAFHESMWGLYTLGGLLFIPGAYYTYIAYQAYYGTPGFSYSDIPTMD